MLTTRSSPYTAVAEKISIFLASVKMERHKEKIAVKTIINPILISIRFTKYSTRITTVGNKDENMDPMVLLIAIIRASLYSRKLVPGYGDSAFCGRLVVELEF